MAAGLAALHGQGVSLCLFHRLTGLPCLTCGSTRAAAALLAGDVSAALRLQPLAVAAAISGAAAYGAHTYFLLARRRYVTLRLQPHERRFALAAALSLAALNWAYLVWRGV